MHIHTLKGYIQNIFLVEDDHQLLLLDGCCRADVDQVCEFITDTLQRPLTDLRLIVVTHMHPDHGGGAHELRQRTGAPIAAHPKAAKWYSGLAGRTAHLIDLGLTYYVAGRLGNPKRHIWYNPILKPDILLDDEQTLPNFPDWQVIYTPGHTDHDISLLHTPSRRLYVADLMVQVRGRIVPPYPLCHPNQYRQSLQRVADLQAALVFFAHLAPRPSDAIPFADMLADAPEQPSNHWYATRNRLLQKMGLPKRQP
ncbi:MAG: MBL fold metallo-hydrolase [Bacterioplanes sp.]|nr:MBL fold metallo-hydrolase [Bacterioplanes sp.]